MENRNEKLQEYIKRLSEGEDLESVRKDFVENFKDVDASEIMKAEQDMMKSGVPYSQVQKLCDVHSALFHGATREEQIANAEKAVESSLKKQNALQGRIMTRALQNGFLCGKMRKKAHRQPLMMTRLRFLPGILRNISSALC